MNKYAVNVFGPHYRIILNSGQKMIQISELEIISNIQLFIGQKSITIVDRFFC